MANANVTFVGFHRPVVFTSTGTDYWSATDRKFSDVTCTDKGTHMLFMTTVQGKRRRIKVPLTNITQVSEEDVLEPKETP